MICEQKRQQRTQKHSSSSSSSRGRKRRARRRQRTRKRHGPTPRLSQTSSQTTKNPTHYKRPIEPSRTTAHNISSTNQQLSSKNLRLSQTQTFSPVYNESRPKRIYRKSSKRLFRRRHTMFHPVIQLLSSTKALPRSHNNAKESPTSLHICNNSTECRTPSNRAPLHRRTTTLIHQVHPYHTPRPGSWMICQWMKMTAYRRPRSICR
jgi:hypothetical protein